MEGFSFYPGSGNPDGSFSIPGVCSDTYTLKFGSTYVVSSQQNLDLGEYIQGRPDVATASNGTLLGISVSDMNPWNTDYDSLEMISSNAGAYFPAIDFINIGFRTPNRGDTMFDAQLDYAQGFPPNLIDASQGDVTTVAQFVTRPGVAGTIYAGMVKAFTCSALTVANGTETDFSSPLADVPQTSTWAPTIDYPSLHAYRAQIHPSAAFLDDEAVISVLPGGNSYGNYTPSYSDLAYMGHPTEIPSLQTFSFTFGNPFPQQQTYSTIGVFYVVAYQLPGTESAARVLSLLGTRDDTANIAQPFTIQLSPALDFRINGQPATGDLSNISQTPELSWSAPELGAATYYSVSVRELYITVEFGIYKTQSRLIALVYTPDSHLVIPPGILEQGKTYMFRLMAHDNPGTDIETVPFIDSFPHSYASTYSGIERP